ncbi:DUF2163 domain-containing protein [Haematobacter genomosp. 1]|uniref:Bacteriophage phiJL001 Gp84 C-terminal domain-containing protein n=1 Tax=Haematobacter genomosp. 1 TaxID=366618 RepID=A0A212ADB3_9RHOB|nr:DUF2163 domain-containing protein [Haematobacter genomosp. 1]OWJ78958.1 hypothetical protein CDV49_07670 [Haematobacter genomosp. 1]
MSSTTLQAHLETGATTVCRCWAVERRDGVRMGFTDHDTDLSFDGILFHAATGMTAAQLEQVTGLAVDNSAASGALTAQGITEEDIAAGRYDGAEVWSWLVNWADVGQRALRFRGEIGEIRRGAGAFEAELRGLADRLNQRGGRAIQRGCTARLGDAACGIDLADPRYGCEGVVLSVTGGRVVQLGDALGGHPARWFERGSLTVLSGAASGLVGLVKLQTGGQVELWQELRAPLHPGDRVRLTAGCDKRLHTCGGKFANTLNFRGFPHVPGEDWLVASPARRMGR